MTPEAVKLSDRLRTERDEALELRTALLGNTWGEQATPEQTSAAVELLEGLAALMDEAAAELERLTVDKAGFLGAP